MQSPHRAPDSAQPPSEAWAAQPWFPDDPAPGPWFRDEQAPGGEDTDEQTPAPGDRDEQPPGPGGVAGQVPGAAEPLTLSDPVWVTDFFRDRPPEVPVEKPQPAYPPRRAPGRIGSVMALAAVVVLLVGGLLTWRLVSGQPGQPSNRAGKSAPGTTAVPSTPASTQATASPTTGAPGPGRITVAMAPALARTPAAQQVATFLETYFRAINQRDYALYNSMLAASMRQSFRQFEAGYRSTSDSGAVLTSLSDGPHGLAAAVTFISHQDPALSPDHTRCTSWDITLYLRRHGASYLIVRPPRGYHAAHEPCV
ncbi:MAG TPA: hypothetical protein VIV12_22365 [Streptosporangiaceae bacterium]